MARKSRVLIGIGLVLCLLVTGLPLPADTGEGVTEDIYAAVLQAYPDEITKMHKTGASETELRDFIAAVEETMTAPPTPLTETNFAAALNDAFLGLYFGREHSDVFDAVFYINDLNADDLLDAYDAGGAAAVQALLPEWMRAVGRLEKERLLRLDGPAVSVAGTIDPIAPGAEAVLDMSLCTAEAVGFVQCDLRFNPAVLTWQGFAAGAAGGVVSAVEVSSGHWRLTLEYPEEAVNPGTVRLGEIHFQAFGNIPAGYRGSVRAVDPVVQNSTGTLTADQFIGWAGNYTAAGRRGDVNGDDAVDLADLAAVAQAYGWEAESTVGGGLAGDLNLDGRVDLYDLTLCARYVTFNN